MKTLLLDNYDSFSRILFQYLWEINGEKPLFVRNDAWSLAQIRAARFDNIVLSPGPGRPDVARDFGVCGEVIRAFPATPILGVCLGHQGLALSAGARIVAAPAPRHGKVSRIRHDGRDLFAGLPQGFAAVRYHSLVVARENPPAGIEVTAESEDDGQVMGLRLRKRPCYGVQFHPESIGTECGKRLLANFRDLSAEWLRAVGATFSASREELETLELPRPSPARAGRAALARELPWRDPEAAFLEFFRDAAAAFWLDSAAGEAAGPADAPRITYMGAGTRIAEARGDAIRIRKAGPGGFAPAEEFREDPFAFLDRDLTAQETWTLPETCTLPGGFRGGWIGCLGYGLKAFAESPVRAGIDPQEFPDALFLDPDRVLAFDHASRKVYALAPATAAASDWMESVVSAWESLGENPPGDLRLHRAGPDPRGLEGVGIPFTLSADKAAYLASIRSLQADILRGESYEACLTNEVRVRAAADPLLVYRILRRTNPAPYAAYLRFPEGAVLSASPERFLKLSEGVLSCRPIKGTRRRGADAEEDAALRSDLADSLKDRSENLMIVDLVRNDFGRVCALGSVAAPELMTVEAHPTVFQLVSGVAGRLAEDKSPLEAVRACFPGGSMTGAPKLRTMELLEARERRPRGLFSGALGYLGRGGRIDLGMVIRTLVWRGGEFSIGCGGAILAESDPESEFDEALLKAMAPLRAVELAETGCGGGWKLERLAPEAGVAPEAVY